MGNLRGVLFQNLINAGAVINYTIQKKNALQACEKIKKYISVSFCHFSGFVKRASLGLSVRASVSIEASLAIPVFLFSFLEILSVLQYLSVYSGVLYGMKTVGDSVCVYGYAYDLLTEEKQDITLGEKLISSAVFSEVYLDTKLLRQSNLEYYKDTIKGGLEGISLLGSYVDRENHSVSVTARYTLKPLLEFAGTEYPVMCRYYGRLWTGYVSESEKDKRYVYITPNGTVYHVTNNCTYLKLSIKRMKKEELNQQRNQYGEKYRACMKCCDENSSKETYYITKSGNRFHQELSCSGLKRTIYKVEFSEVKDLSICNRCGEEE